MTTPDTGQATGTAADAQQTAQGQQPTPPWGSADDFDPDKAWKLIQDLRADKEKLAARPALSDDDKAKLDAYDKQVKASQTNEERLQTELARWQSEAEKWRGTSVASTVKALAATDFADPDDAVRNLDPAKYLDAGGAIDENAIKKDLGALLESKPHYRRPEGNTPRVPAPNHSQGASGAGKSAPDPRNEFAAILGSQLK